MSHHDWKSSAEWTECRQTCHWFVSGCCLHIFGIWWCLSAFRCEEGLDGWHASPRSNSRTAFIGMQKEGQGPARLIRIGEDKARQERHRQAFNPIAWRSAGACILLCECSMVYKQDGDVQGCHLEMQWGMCMISVRCEAGDALWHVDEFCEVWVRRQNGEIFFLLFYIIQPLTSFASM